MWLIRGRNSANEDWRLVTVPAQSPIDSWREYYHYVEVYRLLPIEKYSKGVYGEMCRDPSICEGKGYCPRDPACND